MGRLCDPISDATSTILAGPGAGSQIHFGAIFYVHPARPLSNRLPRNVAPPRKRGATGPMRGTGLGFHPQGYDKHAGWVKPAETEERRSLPFLTTEHMAGYPNLHAADIVDFLNLCRTGKPIERALPPAGMTQREFDQQHQKAELEKSFGYLRNHCNVGIKGEFFL